MTEEKRGEIMKKIAGAILIFFIAAGFSGAQERRGPQIELKQLRYDAGKVTSGTPITHVFDIRNTGDETLVIQKVQPG